MSEEEAIRAIKRVRNSAIVINLFQIIMPIILFVVSPSNLESYVIAYIMVMEVIILGILDGLVFGIYKFKSRICAIILFLCTLFIGLSTITKSVPVLTLLIYAVLLHIYYKGIRATYYFHRNKLAANYD